MAANELTSTADLPLRNRPVNLSGWNSDKTQINFCIEQTGPTDHYFDYTG
jgi:hypothetical protein